MAAFLMALHHPMHTIEPTLAAMLHIRMENLQRHTRTMLKPLLHCGQMQSLSVCQRRWSPHACSGLVNALALFFQNPHRRVGHSLLHRRHHCKPDSHRFRHHFCRSGWGGCTHIRHKISNCEIRFVANTTYDRNGAPKDHSGQRFIIERPQVLQRSASADQHNHIDVHRLRIIKTLGKGIQI